MFENLCLAPFVTLTNKTFMKSSVGRSGLSTTVERPINFVRLYVLEFAVFAASLCVPHASLDAAPITFQFDAEIVHVSPGNPFDLPLIYQVGDSIHGRFTFEPGSGSVIGDNVVAASQPFSLGFEINGTTVGTSGFRIEVFDNTAFDDSEFPEPIDVINLGCNEASCIPDLISLSDGEPFRVRSRMQLVGNSSVLIAPEISADPAVWNAFGLERRLVIGFDNEGSGSMGFDAVVGSMVQVPEPTTLTSLVFTGGIIAGVYVALRRVRYIGKRL
jgi:hypothetical protein